MGNIAYYKGVADHRSLKASTALLDVKTDHVDLDMQTIGYSRKATEYRNKSE